MLSPEGARLVSDLEKRIAAIVAAAIADPDPAIKRVTDKRWKVLMGRVRVSLDGEDVTRVCRGFSIPSQSVELYLEQPGTTKKRLVYFCGCGRQEGKTPGVCDRLGVCQICGQECNMEALTETRTGKVEVLPA